MKAIGFLVGGWVLGGAIVVSMGALASNSLSSRAPSEGPGWEARATRASFPARPGPSLDARDDKPLLIPVEGVQASQLRDDFSQPRSNGRTHHALDILAPHGTPVLAAVDGTIRKLFVSGSGGITIYQFDRTEERVYYYAHLDRYADGLAEGLFVPQGTVIGYVGATGNAHGTNHLHFAVGILPPTKEWSKGTPVDPYPLLVQ